MAKVLGIGGVFFKCDNRDQLTAWYQKYLNINISEYGGSEFYPDKLPDSAYCVWGPFKADTDYFEPSGKQFMINLIVDEVDAALQQVVSGGAQQIGEPEDYDYGRFGWFIDPEGNKIELWQPK